MGVASLPRVADDHCVTHLVLLCHFFPPPPCAPAQPCMLTLHRIEPGSVPEVPHGAHPMTIGRWMEMKGIEAKGQRTPGVCGCVWEGCGGVLYVCVYGLDGC